jgi:hypothetical protein
VDPEVGGSSPPNCTNSFFNDSKHLSRIQHSDCDSGIFLVCAAQYLDFPTIPSWSQLVRAPRERHKNRLSFFLYHALYAAGALPIGVFVREQVTVCVQRHFEGGVADQLL